MEGFGCDAFFEELIENGLCLWWKEGSKIKTNDGHILLAELLGCLIAADDVFVRRNLKDSIPRMIEKAIGNGGEALHVLNEDFIVGYVVKEDVESHEVIFEGNGFDKGLCSDAFVRGEGRDEGEMGFCFAYGLDLGEDICEMVEGFVVDEGEETFVGDLIFIGKAQEEESPLIGIGDVAVGIGDDDGVVFDVVDGDVFEVHGVFAHNEKEMLEEVMEFGGV